MKYFKYLFLLFVVPILLLITTKFSVTAQPMNIVMIDQEIAHIAELWTTASNDQKAKLGLADMLLFSAKDRLAQQPDLASEFYNQAKTITNNPQSLGNPAYTRFTVNQLIFYAIGTDKIAYLLRGETENVSLDSIHYPTQHHSFIKPALGARPLWQASFTRADREELTETFINSVQAKLTATPQLIETNSYRGLHFKWLNVPIPDSREQANIEAELRLYPNSEKSDWYINVIPKGNQNQATKVLYEVEFPIIPNVSKQTGNTNQDYLVFPFQSGELYINPSQTLAKPRKTLYPGHTRWQSLVYYQGNQGMNFMVTDADGYAKTAIAQKADNQTIQLSWLHHPPRQGYPKSKLAMFGPHQNVNYSCRLVTFTGDWYEGAQVYRDWMLQQDFLGTGKPKKLSSNPEAADWAKKMIVSYRTFSPFGWENLPDLLGDESNQVRQVYDFHKANLPNYPGQVSIYAWRTIEAETSTFFDRPEVAPPGRNYIGPRFGEAIAYLRANNLNGNPFIESPLWDVNGTTYKPENGGKIAMLYYNRRPIRVRFGKGKKETVFSWIDVGEEQWIQKQEGIAEALLKSAKSEPEKIDGVYFDLSLTINQLNHRNPNTVGGQHASYGWKNLFQRVNNKARRGSGSHSNPRYTLFTEGMADCFLNLNHFYLHFQQDLPFDIALWGDYNKTYGIKSSWSPLDDDATNDWQQAIPQGRALAWGQPIGRIDSTMIQAGPTVNNFLINLAHHRYVNQDYLSMGRMLKPVTINQIQWSTPPSPAIPANQLPDVMIPNGVFAHSQEGNNTVLFIFVNGAIDRSSATVDFTINPAQYGIPSNYQLYRRTVNGNPATATDTVVGNFSQGSLTQSRQLQPLEIVTYVAKP
ncbi:MAG: hypothetical protein EA365_14385 [Gloeocapsa sp. DLM2.Bin57]|nr:MAG: hypothetical protein EA365_14385 [Gloeocapsa sp. DLM2.Bin57]